MVQITCGAVAKQWAHMGFPVPIKVEACDFCTQPLLGAVLVHIAEAEEQPNAIMFLIDDPVPSGGDNNAGVRVLAIT